MRMVRSGYFPGKKAIFPGFQYPARLLPCLWAASIMRSLNTGPPGNTERKRHKPPVTPMVVAFLVPEASVVLKVLAGQIGVGAVLAAVLWALSGHVAGYSALLGSLTAVIPNAFLALRLTAPRRDPGARALVRAAYIGELGKLALTVLLFSVAFALVRPLVVPARELLRRQVLVRVFPARLARRARERHSVRRRQQLRPR